MQLYSLQFFLFIGILFVLYYTIFRKCQWVLLLIGSLGYYLFFARKGLIFILVTAFSIWLAGIIFDRMEERSKERRKQPGLDRAAKKAIKKQTLIKKRILLVLILALNFGILTFFKIWNLLAAQPAADGGMHLSALILPLGISFYTFQAVAYLADVYQSKYEAEKNFLHFLLFVSWFPQTIQGPINRFDKLRPMYFTEHKPEADRFKRALSLYLFGLMKKYALANILAGMTGPLFEGTLGNRSGSVILIGILLFAIQEYADFSGGIDMVMAASSLFGIDMMRNFRQPYFATSMADFWRRWHITLGAWMRDYVFYPFAVTKPMLALVKWGSKKFGKQGRVLAAAVGNVLVFLIVGVWHGTGWNYVVWGLYNGILIAVSELLAPVFARMAKALHINVSSKGFHIFRIVRTFLLVLAGTMIERIGSLAELRYAITNIFHRLDPGMGSVAIQYGGYLRSHAYEIPVILAVAGTLLFIHSVMEENNVPVYDFLQKRHLIWRWLVYFGVIFLTLLSFGVSGGEGGFLYANY